LFAPNLTLFATNLTLFDAKSVPKLGRLAGLLR
jgi:hypothetical protein